MIFMKVLHPVTFVNIIGASPYEILIKLMFYLTWVSSLENLSSGFPTKRVSNQSPQLQRLARKVKFHM